MNVYRIYFRRVLIKALFLISIFISVTLNAALIHCEEGAGNYGNLENLHYQVIKFQDSGKCIISIGANNRYPKYRSFLFDTTGELMVFNSLGRGIPSKVTGARNYYFPRLSHKLAYEIDKADSFIKVRHTDGRMWIFDAKSAKIHDIERMTFVEDPEVLPTNNGGLELAPNQGHLIDEGWRLGGPPNIILTRKSVIKDSFSNLCPVRNSKIFRHIYDNRNNVNGAIFIYKDPSSWKKFIRKECPFISY